MWEKWAFTYSPKYNVYTWMLCYILVCFKYVKSVKQKIISTSNVIQNSLKLTKNPLIQSNSIEANVYSKKVYGTQMEEFYLPLLFVRK